VRTANHPFCNDYRTFEDYETHFTVMNYGKKLTQINDEEFVKEFNEEQREAGVTWGDVMPKVRALIAELFGAVESGYPQMHLPTVSISIANLLTNLQARAVYGMDLMIARSH